jgi:hypothetical protein
MTDDLADRLEVAEFVERHVVEVIGSLEAGECRH